MKFKCDSQYVNYTSYQIKESFNQNYSICTVKAPVGMAGEVTVETDKSSFSLWAVDIKDEKEGYTTTLVPKVIHDLNQKTFPILKGQYTISQVLNYYGLKYLFLKDTPTQYWEFPEMKLLEFLNTIKFLINTGNAPVFTVDILGAFRLIDLKQALDSEAWAEIKSDYKTQEWNFIPELNVPQCIELNNNMITADTNLSIKGSSGHGIVKLNRLVTVEELAYQNELKVRNMSGVMKYTSYSIQIQGSNNVMPILGATVEFKQNKFVVVQVELNPGGSTVILSREAYK